MVKRLKNKSNTSKEYSHADNVLILYFNKADLMSADQAKQIVDFVSADNRTPLIIEADNLSFDSSGLIIFSKN